MKSWKLTESKIDYYRPFCLLLRNAEKIMSLLVVFYVEIRQKVPKIATNSFSIADMILVFNVKNILSKKKNKWKFYFSVFQLRKLFSRESKIEFCVLNEILGVEAELICDMWSYQNSIKEDRVEWDWKIEKGYFSWTKVGKIVWLFFQSEKCNS